MRPPTAAAEVEEETEDEAEVGPPRGDRMGKPLSFATEDSSFCHGTKLALGKVTQYRKEDVLSGQESEAKK